MCEVTGGALVDAYGLRAPLRFAAGPAVLGLLSLLPESRSSPYP
jgi:hypothetical protein